MTSLGITLGLGAAALQSAAYVFTRRYVVVRGSSVRLLVIAHVIMGAISLGLLPLLWDDALKDMGRYAVNAIGASGTYMLGQAFLFATLRYADASRISPLLGLKVVMVAIIWITMGRETIGLWQWGAVGLSVAAAFVLNYSGGSLPIKSIVLTLATCLCYAASDVFIVDLVRTVGEPGSFTASMRATCIAYIVCGFVGLLLLPKFGSRDSDDWTTALPFAGTWYTCMLCLFAALAMIGPVMGNIVLATRGLFSIGLGVLLASMGMLHLERHVAGSVLMRRAIAAVMMIIAIALYGMHR